MANNGWTDIVKFLLLETGGRFLLETGGRFILEPVARRYSVIDLSGSFVRVINGDL